MYGFSLPTPVPPQKAKAYRDRIPIIAAMRHLCHASPERGRPMVASQHSTIPIINAGDGGHQHPTQYIDRLTNYSVSEKVCSA